MSLKLTIENLPSMLKRQCLLLFVFLLRVSDHPRRAKVCRQRLDPGHPAPRQARLVQVHHRYAVQWTAR